MAAMLTARIDDAGTQLAYVDSGPLPNETYTTLVVVHGFVYHSQIFSKLFPVARSHNLRIIALNRRDYVGSTPYSPSELGEIITSDGTRSAFLQARGLEISRFLIWVIKELKIPPVSANGREGGLTLLGWSLGNITTMAFLGNLKTYPSEMMEVLELYLKTFFIYDPDYVTLGYPDPEGGYLFYNDESDPPHLLGQHFGTWVSSYYTHPYYHSSQEGQKENQGRSLDSLHLRTPEADEKYRSNTQETFTPEELATVVDPIPMSRSDGPFTGFVKRSTLYEQARRALLKDYDSQTASVFLPDIKISFVYCSASIWTTTWCAWELEKDIEKWKAEDRSPRPIRFRLVDGANHFLHWDDPDLFLRVAAEGIRG